MAFRTLVLRNKQPQVIKENLESEERITELVAPGGKFMRLSFILAVSLWAGFFGHARGRRMVQSKEIERFCLRS
jgi:hypothetical protein